MNRRIPDRYVRWCERTVGELITYFLLDVCRESSDILSIAQVIKKIQERLTLKTGRYIGFEELIKQY